MCQTGAEGRVCCAMSKIKVRILAVDHIKPAARLIKRRQILQSQYA